MKHEVKIPSDCKATVFVEDKRIVIVVDPIQKQTKEKGEPCDPFSILKSRVYEQVIQRSETQSDVDKSVRIVVETEKDESWKHIVNQNAWKEVDRKINSSVSLGAIRKPNESGEYVVGTIFENKKESAPKEDIEAHCYLGEGDSIGVLSLIKDGRVQTSINLDKLTGKESIDVPHIPAFAGQFLKSDTGYIAMTGEQNYAVVLTPTGEIQLNQSCNFPITIPAKFDDSDKLMTELAKQKALMIVGKELVKWRPATLACEPFSAINAVWKAKTYLSMEDGLMDDLLLADNIFPPGFLTEEKISQFKSTVMDLFDSWRQ